MDFISDFINSPNFKNSCKKFKPVYMDKVLGLAIEFLLYKHDEEYLNKYINDLLEYSKESKVPSGNYWDIAPIKKEYSSILDKANTGYFYHSFNGVFKESIEKDGLNPNIRNWEWSEIEQVQKIFAGSGLHSIFGFINLNSKGKVSVSDNFQSLYKYAITSPEWFGYFCSWGYHFPDNTSVDKDAYKRKDYAAAKQNIVELLKYLQMGNFTSFYIPNVNFEELVSRFHALYLETYKDSKGLVPENMFYELYAKEFVRENVNGQMDLEDRKSLTSFQSGQIMMAVYNAFINKVKGGIDKVYLSDEECAQVLYFFDKHWKLFATRDLYSLVIPQNQVKNASKVSSFLISNYPNYQTAQIIYTNGNAFIKLPTYKDVFE